MDSENEPTPEIGSPTDGLPSVAVASPHETSPSVETSWPEGGYPRKPWLTIWSAPRKTIRAIVDSDPTRHVLLLAAIAGVAGALNRSSNDNGIGNILPTWGVVLVVVVLGPLGGLLSLYVGGAILRWIGSRLGGRASSEEVRAAIAWSALPRIAVLVLWLPYLTLYGTEVFIGSCHHPGHGVALERADDR